MMKEGYVEDDCLERRIWQGNGEIMKKNGGYIAFKWEKMEER